MFGIGCLPCLCQLLASPLIVESPRWLVFRGDVAAARSALRRLRGANEDGVVADELNEIFLSSKIVRPVAN